MKHFVVDASVILYYLLETDSNISKQIQQFFLLLQKKRVVFHSPYFLHEEVGNGLRFSKQDIKTAEESLSMFQSLPIQYETLSYLHYKKILRHSIQLNTTYYDTSYHYLALINKYEFLTCDKAYFQKAKQLGCIKLMS